MSTQRHKSKGVMVFFQCAGAHNSAVRIHATAGSVSVETASLFADGDDAHLDDLIRRLFRLSTVKTITVDRGKHSVEIDYDRDALPLDAALRSFSDAIERLPCPTPLDRLLQGSGGAVKRVERNRNGAGDNFIVHSGGIVLRPTAPAQETGAHHKRFRRIVDLALGGACFLISIVGIMTPFIPTMPFVLATGYFLARSSATLHDLFRRSPLFGEMLGDWEEHGGWRMATKLKLFALMVFLWGVTIAIAGFSWPLVIVMGLMSSISVVTILRVQTISDDGLPRKPLAATA